MVKLSVVLFTIKAGGMDMLAEGLARQTYKDYELIIIDDWPKRDHDAVVKYFNQDYGIPLSYHGPSKQKCYPHTRYGQANAINSGFLRSKGDVVVVFTDYSMPRPSCLERWAQLFDYPREAEKILAEAQQPPLSGAKYMGVGTALEHTYDRGGRTFAPKEDDSISCFEKPFTNFDGCRAKSMFWTVGYGVLDMFHFAIPRDILKATNGLDERSDIWRTAPAEVYTKMIELNGFRWVVDNSNILDLIDHRPWDQGNGVWHISHMFGSPDDPGIRPEAKPRAPNCFSL